MQSFVAGRLARSPWVERLARAGLAAKGVSFGIVAVLAIEVATGHGGETTDRQGALRAVARHPFGKTLLVLLAIGFAGYALWRLAQAALDREGEGEDAKGIAKRAGYLGRAAIYAGLLATTISILVGSGGGGGGGSSSGSGEKRATGGVLGWPLGRELVAAVGLAVAVAGLFNGYRAVTRTFLDKLELPDEGARRLATATGVAGLLARLVVFCLVGAFLGKAAVEYDPQDAIGLDGALQKLARQAYGSWLLSLVAAGLLAYGLYCLVEARYRKL